MTETAGDALVSTLIDWGVEVVFGLPGDGINGIMESLRKRQHVIRFIQVRHEESAAFMACGYAKYTGRLGVCLATSGPGGLHLLNGLYDAKMDGQPVLAITGLSYHDLIGTYTQQDVELDKVFMDVAVYNQRVMGPAHVENVTDLACRTALSRRGVAHISIPVDVQDQAVGEHSKRNVPGHTSESFDRAAGLPPPAELEKAAGVLNQGQRVLILAGRGALGAGDALEALAQKLGAPIAKALLGKSAVPDDSPLTTGGIGMLGTRPTLEAVEACDTLLMVGTSFPYIEALPKPSQARSVQIDRDASRIGLRYPVEVGLVGSARPTLEALLPLVDEKLDKSFLDDAQSNMADWRALMAERGSRRDMPMKPQVVAHELGQRLADDAIVAADSGTITVWWARHIPSRRGQIHSVSGTLASMACALPYAIAAQLAYPGRQVVAFVGDGGLSMLLAELATCVKYDLPVKVVVIKNNYLAMIKWEQLVFLGNPEYGVDLQPIDFAKAAEACGFSALRVEDPDRCGDIIEQALRMPGPVLVEAVTDPLEAPLPPRTTREDALKLAQALLKGQPEGIEIARSILTSKVRESL
jgi:pyruvate dehydrogenase (quinone)/pyruvate oxidase